MFRFTCDNNTSVLSSLLLAILLISSTTIVKANDFTQAINAAMREVVQKSSFQSQVSIYLQFNVPKCSASADYPKMNPFRGMTKLKNCYQLESTEPWISAYQLVAQELTNTINTRYSISLENTLVLINTTSDGFFTSFVNAINDGRCDVVVADVSFSSERATLVSFQTCPYGVTSFAFIRNNKDNDTIGYDTNVYSLNRNGTIVGSYSGTIFEEWIKENLPLATYRPLGFDEQFDAVANNLVHAIIGDAVDFSIYLGDYKSSCSVCKVVIFGDPSTFGTITKASQQISNSSQFISNTFLSVGLLLLFLVF